MCGSGPRLSWARPAARRSSGQARSISLTLHSVPGWSSDLVLAASCRCAGVVQRERGDGNPHPGHPRDGEGQTQPGDL